MYTTRKKNFTVTITDGDREAVRRGLPSASLTSIDRRAIARAAGRDVFLETKCTAEALDWLTSGIPEKAVQSWMKGRLKKVA